jgi:hypothetical protein
MFEEEGEKLIEQKIDQSFRVRFLEGMQKLEVRDGDTVVIKTPFVLSAQTHENLREAVKQQIKDFGYNVNVMLLEEGIDIGVLRK